MNSRIIYALFLICCACRGPKNNPLGTVHISTQGNNYILYRNGKSFLIKGAAGFGNIRQLKEAGGNTLRIWDTAHIDSILKLANQNGIAVIVGLPIPNNDNMNAFYNNDVKVKAQLDGYRKFIDRYKDNPAVLLWCLGNEVDFPFKPKYNAFYRAYNALVDMIHQEDPNHPVTTTMINFRPRYVFNISYRTNIDVISFNIFGEIKNFETNRQKVSWWWKGPFIISEWGIDGPWQGHEQTAWAAYVEPTSTKKAEQYIDVYQKYMPVKDSGFFGSLVFLWGQKQETTPTWFSLFDEASNKSETVNALQYLWTGKWPAQHAPAVNYMLLNEKGARDNIILKADTTAQAKVFLTNTAQHSNLRFEWVILPEDWFKKGQFINNTTPMKPVKGLFTSVENDVAIFKTPEKEGPYRIFVKIKDDNGYFATANTPFYVAAGK